MATGDRQRMRRRARRALLQVLYEVDMAGHPLAACLQHVLGGTEVGAEGALFVSRMAAQILERREALDGVIQRYAPAWPVAQLSAVDRSVLRIALYELTFARETPPKVVINEAVELAKQFGGEGSPRFVNGVLGSVMAAQEGKEAVPTDRDLQGQEVDGARSPGARQEGGG